MKLRCSIYHLSHEHPSIHLLMHPHVFLFVFLQPETEEFPPQSPTASAVTEPPSTTTPATPASTAAAPLIPETPSTPLTPSTPAPARAPAPTPVIELVGFVQCMRVCLYGWDVLEAPYAGGNVDPKYINGFCLWVNIRNEPVKQY